MKRKYTRANRSYIYNVNIYDNVNSIINGKADCVVVWVLTWNRNIRLYFIFPQQKSVTFDEINK